MRIWSMALWIQLSLAQAFWWEKESGLCIQIYRRLQLSCEGLVNPIDGACSKASVINNYEDNSWAFVVITCLFA